MLGNRKLDVALLLAVGAATAVGCGIAIRRDLSTVPAGRVGFDDMCGLQEYFDALEIHTSPPPQVVSALDLEGKEDGGHVARGGRERFAFDNDYLLKHLRRVLNENWRRLPDEVQTAKSIEIEVQWSEKAGTKRVVTDRDAQISIGGQSWGLPYHVCLSELLYGEPLYRQRRQMWNLPLPVEPVKPPASGLGTGPSDAGSAATDGGLAPPSQPAVGPR
jgi:hypothetical protein